MTVYFQNQEPIDIAAITTMGVSVKTGDKPIGYFGTGLKYAIATLLRTGHKVELTVAGTLHTFAARPQTIRDVEFNIVHMNNTPLGFTTDLGRNWEVWQTFRELHSNTLDEGGCTTLNKPAQGDYKTVFKITGSGIDNAYFIRSEIFLESVPITTNSNGEIHPGASKYVYYRGVRAAVLKYPALCTYNLLSETELTEDRTIKTPWVIRDWCEDLIPELTDVSLIEEIIMAPMGVFEKDFHYSTYITPTPEFLEAVGRVRHNVNCNQSAVEVWKKYNKAETIYKIIELNKWERAQLQEALTLLCHVDCDIQINSITFVESLGAQIYGLMKDGEIMISRNTFDMGTRFLASTIYEEWIHKTHHYADNSRGMQNFLFERLFVMISRLETETEARAE